MRTALTIEAHGRKITVEFEDEDIIASEWVDALEALMVGITFERETIRQAFREKAEGDD